MGAETEQSTQDDETIEDRSPSKLWLLVGAAGLFVGVGVMQLASAKAPQGEGERVETPAPLVEIATISQSDGSFLVEAPGRLSPRQTLAVVGEVQGKVVYVNPKLQLGGRLNANEVLFRIDTGDVDASRSQADAQLATANARLAQANAEYARQLRLRQAGATPEQVVEQAKAALEDARAAVEQAEAQVTIASRNVTKSTVRAPFPAIVMSEDVTLGSFVAPGTVLAQLMDSRAAEMRVGLSPSEVAAVRAALQTGGEDGGPVKVRAVPNSSSLSTIELEGTLDTFAPMIDPASRTVTVVAVFPDAFSESNDGLVFAEDFMTLQLSGRADETLWAVPEAAIRQDSYVWVLNQDEAIEKVDIRPVDRRDDRVLVTSGRLDGDERVMTTVLAEEVEGLRVRTASEGS